MDIAIDGTQIASEMDLHDKLADLLDFGPYYGKNIAALWDRLSTDVERPIRLIWRNAAKSRAAMGLESFDRFVKLFRDVENQDKELGLKEKFTFLCE